MDDPKVHHESIDPWWSKGRGDGLVSVDEEGEGEGKSRFKAKDADEPPQPRGLVGSNPPCK